MAYRVARLTQWFACDRCRNEGTEPVYELAHVDKAVTTWHYFCRAHALKCVTVAELDEAAYKSKELTETRKALRCATMTKTAPSDVS